MRLVKFRITSHTIALFPVEGRHAARTIPGGSVISIEESLLDQKKLVDVIFNGTKVMMFAQDVRARGERVEENGAFSP